MARTAESSQLRMGTRPRKRCEGEGEEKTRDGGKCMGGYYEESRCERDQDKSMVDHQEYQ